MTLKKLRWITLILLLTRSTLADPPEVVSISDDGIESHFVIGEDLSAIHSLLAALQQVVALTGEAPKLDASQVTCFEEENEITEFFEAKCHAPLKGFLPEKFSELLNKDLPEVGPNCWNAALVTVGLIQEIRYSSGTEFRDFLNSEHCKPVERAEDRMPGDIIAIRNRKEGEVHAMIYLTQDHVFSKNGKQKDNHYVIWFPGSLYSYYGAARPECRFQVGIPDSNICPESWANVYRCRALPH